MIAMWMLYSVGVSAVLGLCALALEHGVRRSGMPMRWLWAAALFGSLALGALPWIDGGEGWSSPFAEREAAEIVVFERAIDAPASPPVTAGSRPTWRGALSSLDAADSPLLALWGLASAAGLLYLMGTHRTLARRRRIWRRTTLDGVHTLVSREVGPAVVGFLDAAIVVPGWVVEMDPEQRRLVLAHEEEHLRAGDARLLSLALVALALAPWNAALWWQLRRLRHAVELDCDARVLDGDADAERYCDLLIEVGARASMRGVAFAAFAESSSFLERRIMSMVGPRPRRWTVAAGIGVTLAGFLLLYACEAPVPTLPDVGGEKAEPELIEFHAEPEASRETVTGHIDIDPAELRAPRIAATREEENPAAIDEQEEVRSHDVAELVRRRYPEVYSRGLGLEQAVWFAVGADGKIGKSWIAPNIYINFDTYKPVRAFTLPRGSAERTRAEAEHRRLEREIVEVHVPGMQVRGIYAGHFYFPPGNFTVHFITETPGTPMPGTSFTLATRAVNEALRAELER